MAEKVNLGYEDLEFEEIEETYDTLSWKPAEPGDNIIGKYITSEPGKGRGSDLTFHQLEDTYAQKVSILGSTVLNRKLERIEPGTIIKIIYNGKKSAPKNGRKYNDYSVLVASNN